MKAVSPRRPAFLFKLHGNGLLQCIFELEHWTNATLFHRIHGWTCALSSYSFTCSSSSPLSSYSSSSCFHPSPMHRFQYPTQGKGFLPSFFNGKSVFLTESRSLAPASMRGNKNCREKKKGGLWSKLLCRPKYKKVEGGLVRYSRFNPIRKGLVGD